MVAILVVLGAVVAGLLLSVVMTWAGNRSVVQNMVLATLVLVVFALLLLVGAFVWTHRLSGVG